MRWLWIYCLLIGGWIPSLQAQIDPDHPGFPTNQTFTKTQDPLLGQIWALTQDRWGNIVAGCNHGILYYNGHVWRNLKVGNYTSCLSLDRSDIDSIIYVGGENEVGYLIFDSLAQLRYRSLLPFLPESHREIGKVWDTYATREGIFFRSQTHLLLWREEQFEIWQHPQGFDRSFWAGQQLLIQIRNQGLMRLEGGDFIPVPGSEWLAGKRLRSILFRDAKPDLFITRQHGIYLWEYNDKEPVSVATVTRDPSTQLYRAFQDQEARIFLGTVGEGIIQLDDSLQYVAHWNENVGLSNSTVYQFYLDREGNMWVGTKQGCNLLAIGAPHRYLRHKHGLPDNLTLLTHHEGKMFVAGNTGLFLLDKHGEFSKVPRHFSNIYGLNSHATALFVGAEQGISMWKDNEWENLTEREVRYLDVKGNLLVAGMQSTLSCWRLRDHKWQFLGDLQLKPSEIPKDVLIRNDQEIWISTAESVIRLSLPVEEVEENSWPEAVKIFRLEAEDLPQKGSFRLFINHKGVFLYSRVHTAGRETPLFRFDPDHELFLRDQMFANISPPHVFRPNYEDAAGNIWGETYNPATNTFDLSFLPSDSSLSPALFGQLNGNLGYFLKGIHADTSRQIAWALGSQGITVFDQSKLHAIPSVKQVQIQEVVVEDSSLKVLFGGFYPTGWQVPEIPFPVGRMRFVFSLIDFELPHLHFFQYHLEGLEEDWSPWSQKQEIEYTSLSEGRYVFKVRALDAYGQMTEVDEFEFVMLPPWYRSWWARACYLLVGIFLFWGVIRLRNEQLRKKNERLEQEIELRTEELAEANLQLRELDQIKSRFFTNISHEFRTPLSLIIGPIENWLETEASKRNISTDQLLRMHRNAGNLLRLVNQLLDLARLDAKEMTLRPIDTELVAFFRGIAANFSSLAEQKDIAYDIIAPQKKLQVLLDREKFQTILSNLLSNAFKFCPEQGEISVALTLQEIPASNKHVARIRVADSGMGIPEHQQKQIFDRFYQTKESSHQGSGIGLALTQELVDLMGGKIWVENQQGAVFYVEIPCSLSSMKGVEELQPTPELLVPLSRQETEVMTLLLVEDHEDIRAFIREQLVPEYSLLEARSGEEGLNMALTHVPDLIISDLMMPVMDGLEMSRQLKQDERSSHIPIILLTAKAEVEDRIAGFDEGADAYLVKPFHMKELKARINNLLLQRQELRKRFATELTIQPQEITVSSADARFLERAIQIVEEQMAEEDFGVKEFREQLALSRTQLHRKLKALTDQSPSEFIRTLRLKRAAQLLEGQVDNVSQVAFMVGFHNLSYFAKCFKDLFGVVPSEYPSRD